MDSQKTWHGKQPVQPDEKSGDGGRSGPPETPAETCPWFPAAGDMSGLEHCRYGGETLDGGGKDHPAFTRALFLLMNKVMNTGFKYGFYILAFLIALGISAYATVMVLVKAPPEVSVPDLSGRDAVTALKILSDAGLNLKVRAIDYSDTVPRDNVISQDPLPGSRLKKNRDVRVVLSKGNAEVQLPDLRGLALDQARSILAQSRLEAGLLSYAYGSGPEQGRDRVLAQSPESPASMNAGGKVDLLLSLGPRPEYIIMPDLTGQLYSLALLHLENQGLSLGRLTSEHLADWPVGTVVVQDPPPGSRTAKGTLVKLTVNRTLETGPEEYRLQLVDYDVSLGLLNREVKVRVALGSYLWDIHEDWYAPGGQVMIGALVRGGLQGHIYEDGEEVAALGADTDRHSEPGTRAEIEGYQ